ncbi:MAG: guanylate kinase [Spirochaetes bacterium]|nr:guanylate kinase [Spirochaetota bacterium]
MLIVSAPSGAGKTSIIRRLLETDDRIGFSVSTTSRPKREGEQEGDSYYYEKPEKFVEMIEKDEFYEWASVHGNYYGTSKKEIDRIKKDGKIPILDVDVQGAGTIKGKTGSSVLVFVIPPSLGILEKRLRSRGTETEAEISLRLKNARIELAEYLKYDYIVINEIIDEAVAQIKSIITAELSKTARTSGKIKIMLEGGR